MKLILSIALIFLAGISYGQFVPQPLGGNPGSRSFVRGAISADSGYVLTQFPDTLTANKGPNIKKTHGLMIQVQDTVFVRNVFRSQWVRLAGAGGSVIIPPASGVQSISFDGYSLCWLNAAGVETCYDLNNIMHFVPRADSSYTDVLTNGVIVDSIPSFLTPIASGDTCILIRDSSNGVKYFYQNPNCKGSGGGSGGRSGLDSVYLRFDSLQIFTYASGRKDTFAYNGGGSGGTLQNLQQVTDRDSVTTHSIKVGKGIFIGNGKAQDSLSTAFGRFALANSTTGTYNTAGGFNALRNNTTGLANTAFGTEALLTTTTTQFTSAFGSGALDELTIGLWNNAFGASSLGHTTTGERNNSFGTSTMSANTTGSYNSAFGPTALTSNTTGNYNTAIGARAMYLSNGTDSTVGIGASALYGNSGKGNVAVGAQAMYFNSSGGATGGWNTAVGYQAGYNFNLGIGNVAVGFLSSPTSAQGSWNTTLGSYAGFGFGNGNYNIALGYFSGNSSVGSRNFFAGLNAQAGAVGDNDQVTLGTDALGANKRFTLSDSLTSMRFKNLNALGTAAPNVVGVDGSGLWHVYPAPSGGGGSASGIDSMYVTSDSLYIIFIYKSGRRDSVNYVGGGGSGGSGPTITASNGLTKVVNDIQLSGTLLAGGANINATVDNNLSISSTDGTGSPHGAFRVNHTGTMEAVHIFNSGGVGLHVASTGSSALSLFATSSGATGVAVYGQNTGGGYGGEFISQGSVAAGIQPALFLVKTSATYADGTGVSIPMSGNGGNISNTITSKWTTNKTNAGNGFSVMEISGHQNGIDNTILSLSGNGAAKANKYGLGTFTGTAAFNLGVTSSGDIIEVAAGGGGGGLTYPNTAKKYLNGYGAFPALNADSIVDGATNIMLTNTTQTIPGQKQFTSAATYFGPTSTDTYLYGAGTGAFIKYTGSGAMVISSNHFANPVSIVLAGNNVANFLVGSTTFTTTAASFSGSLQVGNGFGVTGNASATGTISAPTGSFSDLYGTAITTAYAAKTAAYTITAADNTIDCTSGTFTVTLPAASTVTGKEFWVTNTGSGTITLATGQTFTNVSATPTSVTIPQFTNYKVKSTGTNYLAYKIIN